MVHVYEEEVSKCGTPWTESYRLMVPAGMIYEHQEVTAMSA